MINREDIEKTLGKNKNFGEMTCKLSDRTTWCIAGAGTEEDKKVTSTLDLHARTVIEG
jgi:hypothetical protein